MFDIGFTELMVIAVVALVVIGPERLPKVARTLGHLFGRMQRYVNDVKADINREMALDDLRKLQASMQESAQSLEQSVRGELGTAEQQIRQVAADAQSNPDAAPGTTPAAASMTPSAAEGDGAKRT
jgi:sec-independent protein translocase protein TatB